MPKIQHRKLAEWLDLRRRAGEPVDLGQLKKALAGRGVNGRGWRLYLDFGDALFAPLGRPWVHDDQPFTSGPNAVAWLRLLQACEMDVPPPPALVASLASWPIPADRLDALPPLFFRAAWKGALVAAYEDRPLEEFIDDEVLPVCRWLHAAGCDADSAAGLFKAGWPSLLARASVWEESRRHAPSTAAAGTTAPTGPSGAEMDEWGPYVRRVEWGRCRFVALTTARQLAEEGVAMAHCVGDYDQKCRNNVTRIYSVRERKNGLRIATMSLKYVTNDDGSVWEHDQIKGVRNAEPPADVLHAADAVLRIYHEMPPSTFAPPKPRVVCTLPFDEECDLF